jgi:hypothetical protein
MRAIFLAATLLGAGCSKSSPPPAESLGPQRDLRRTMEQVAADRPSSLADAPAGGEGRLRDRSAAPSDVGGAALDPDGVQMIRPSMPGGRVFRLGASDPNATADFEIEKGTKAAKTTDGKCTFWNLPSHTLSYASGGTGWTTRLHIYASGTMTQLDSWKTQKGWLATPADPKSQELTVYARPHTFVDAKRAAFSLKIRGGRHTSRDPPLASCTMMTFAGPATSGVARFGKELDHPTYDYVKLTPTVTAQLADNVWVGLKLVSYAVANDPKRVRYLLYIDRQPFDPATCKPANMWELFSAYDDVEGKDTGSYTKLADWGGMVTTFRTDGLKDIDFALVSFREIFAP